jgi:dTDP-4-amino-4,6-dideoxygalactose transaminase
MQTELDAESRLQPRKPFSYRLRPVVQPQWHWWDLVGTNPATAADGLRKNLCERYGVKHCLLLDRARSGIFLLCRAFGLNGEWIMTSLMHRPTAVVLANHSVGVVFADVDEDMTISPASVERMVGAQTSAILATHTYGKAADIKALRALADRRGLALIENAVHLASNCKVDGRPLGAWGDASVVSFNVDKPLGGILGGALLTNRDDIWDAVSKFPLGPPNTLEMRERIRTTYTAYRLKPLLLRLPVGRKHRGEADGVAEIEHFGLDTYRSFTPRRIHPWQAKVALSCLHRESGFTHVRTEHALRLNDRLRADDRFCVPLSTTERPHTFTYYPLVLREGSRLNLGEHLARAGIESKWRLAPLHCQRGFTTARHDDLSVGDRVWKQHLLLPVGPCTSDRDIEYLADALLAW